MGWYFGNHTRKDVIRELTEENDAVRTIRKFTSGNTLWTVQENKKSGERFIGCYLMQGREGSRDGWGYKPMEESMGPCELTCPPVFFTLVADPGGYATEWRKRVLEDHARRNLKLSVGDIVRLTNNHDYKVTSVRPLKGYDVSPTASNVTYRLPRRMLAGKVTSLVVTVIESKEQLAAVLDAATKGGE